LGPTQPPIQWVPRLFPEANRPRHGVDHSTHLVPRLKKEKNYTYTPPAPSWPVLGRILPLPFTSQKTPCHYY